MTATLDCYPRMETCRVCQEREVDVIGPGDVWAMCPLCFLARAEEVRSVPTIDEEIAFERAMAQHVFAMVADPRWAEGEER